MYTNDPFVIAQNNDMVAINSAIQVDLTGQVCADSIGTRPYSGFGGQLDFMRGAARSKGRKADYCAAIHRQERYRVADRAYARRRRRGGDDTGGRALCGYGVWRGVPAR